MTLHNEVIVVFPLMCIVKFKGRSNTKPYYLFLTCYFPPFFLLSPQPRTRINKLYFEFELGIKKNNTLLVLLGYRIIHHSVSVYILHFYGFTSGIFFFLFFIFSRLWSQLLPIQEKHLQHKVRKLQAQHTILYQKLIKLSGK